MNGSSRKQVTFAIEAQKMRSCLLNIHHPTGGPKARFFIGWGFRVDDSAVFAASLVAHACPPHHVKTTTSHTEGAFDLEREAGDRCGRAQSGLSVLTLSRRRARTSVPWDGIGRARDVRPSWTIFTAKQDHRS